MLVTRKSFLLKSKKDAALIMTTGVLLGIHWVTLFHSVQVSSVAIGSLSMGTIPLFVSFLEPLFTKSKLRSKDLIAALAVLIGIIIITPEISLENSTFLGIMWGLVSAFTMALRSVITKNFRDRYSASQLMMYQIAVVCLMLTPFALHTAPDFSKQDIVYVSLLALVVTAGGHTLMVKSLEHLKASTVSIIGSIQPAYSILYALLLLGEVPALRTVIGGLIIMYAAISETYQHSRSKIQLAEKVD